MTGSSGMIGSALIHKLAEKYHVIGFDHDDGYPFPPAEAECVSVDLTSDDLIAFAFKRVRYAYGNKIASVIHLAAYYDFLGEPSDLYDKVIHSVAFLCRVTDLYTSSLRLQYPITFKVNPRKHCYHLATT